MAAFLLFAILSVTGYAAATEPELNNKTLSVQFMFSRACLIWRERIDIGLNKG
jgi:hypothetical protein